MLTIICPSAGRPKNLLAKNAIHLDGVCVPESQEGEYHKHNPEVPVIAHPDSVDTLAAKRQWIYDTFGDVFMIDDDVQRFRRTYLPRRQSSRSKIDADTATDLVRSLYEIAEEMGVYLFAPAKTADTRKYKATSPLSLTGMVNGAAFGLRAGSELFFHPEITGRNDTFVSGLNAHIHRMCFLDNRFGPEALVYKNLGGLAPRRSQETEDRDLAIVEKSFGKAIVEKEAAYGQQGRELPGRTLLSVPF